MKTIRKNGLKLLVLLFVAVFMTQTLCFSLGSPAMAEVISLASSTKVVALADTSVKQLKNAKELADWLTSGTETNVELAGGTGTVYDLKDQTYSTKATFAGVFNGNYCTILGVNKPLFGTVSGKNTEIKNVFIGTNSESPSKIESTSSQYVGAIARVSDSAKFVNCINNAPVSGTYFTNNRNSADDIVYVGGIVGYAKGTTQIEQCSNHASVTAGDNNQTLTFAGGIVGYAERATRVRCSYVAPVNKSETINVTATAIELTDASTTFKNKGESKYYNGLTHIVEEANSEVDKVKNEIAGYEGEASALQRSINSVKSEINSLENQIRNYDTKINNTQSKINKAKWYDVRKIGWAAEIVAYRIAQAGLRVAQGALWVSVGALEASRAIVYGAMEAAKFLLSTLAAVITYTLRDTNWLEVTANATKTVTHSDAYAYGIGYFVLPDSGVITSSSDKPVTSSYTLNVNTYAGYRQEKYKYPLKFWSTSEWLRGLYSSGDITDYITFKEENNYGPIINSYNIANSAARNKATKSSQVVENAFYYTTGIETYAQNRFIYIQDTNNSGSSNWYGMEKISVNKHQVHVSFEKQKLIYSTTGTNKDEIVVMLNNGRDFLDNWVKDFAGLGTKFDSKKFDRSLPFMVGSEYAPANASDTSKQQAITNILVSSDGIWGQNEAINNGFPYLKCRYWQEI